MSVAITCAEESEELKLQCERIDLALKQCQSDALENSPSMIDSLQTLYNLLIEMKPMAIQSDLSRSRVEMLLRDVARDLIYMNRVVMSIDDEIEGVVKETLYDDFGWYDEASDSVAQICIECDGNNERVEVCDEYNAPCHDAERWIDKCLDLCGYGVSLEAAVDCLRRTVHYSSSSSNNDDSNNDIPLQEKGGTFGIASSITSLRTIRRYLLHVPSLYQEGHVDCCPITFQRKFLSDEDTSILSQTESIWNCCILPLEYHCKRVHEELGDSLADLTSVLPTLVSSVCHAMDLTLPWWAAPKTMHIMLIQAAWKMLLTGELVGNQDEEASAFRQSTASYFQLLARQMIQNGQSAVISKYLYHCWKYCGENNCGSSPSSSTPRSMLSAQCLAIIDSISSNRVVATFYREMLRCSARYCAQKYSHDEELSMTCKQNILPFLQDTIYQPLIANEEVRDAIVNFIILSPPSSFQHYLSPTGCPSLSFLDRAVPHCVALLLHLACISCHESGSDAESESDDPNATSVDAYLSHLSSVASVWSEDVFVSRSGVLQQQFVTEFLLCPLRQNLISEEDFQKGITSDGTSLASTLVQGVTLRLDISLSQPIRMDGMRIAEAMASLLGQHLRFDELHPANEETMDGKEEETKVDQKPKSRKGRNRAIPTRQVMIDPDAEYFTDESDSSSSQSEAGSSMNSSWGEDDSLEAYSLDDDEEDLRRVALPRTLQDCFAYLVAPDSDNLACDKQQAALMELARLVETKPFDLIDMTTTLVRVLLHLEDKFGLSMFADKKWECLLAFGIHAPLDTCVQLVEEMKGGVSLGTRVEALSIIAATAERLSVSPSLAQSSQTKNITAASVGTTSTRLKIALGLREDNDKEVGGDVVTTSQAPVSKTRRWRQPRVEPKTTTNNFGPIAAHMIYALFALMASTKENASIWGGSTGERFLSEFIKTLSIMVDCASAYPSHAVSALATDLFELAWSFHDANSVEVRRSVLLAMATCMQMMPMDVLASNCRMWLPFLKESSMCDSDEECRKLSTIMMGSFADMSRHQFIE